MSRPAPHLKIVSDRTQTSSKKPAQKQSLGRILLAQNWVTENDLLKAWSIQAYEEAAIGEILIGMDKITHEQLYWALGKLHNLDIVDLEIHPPSMNWTQFTSPVQSLKMGYIIWRYTDDHMTVAITDPNIIEMLKKQFSGISKLLNFVLVAPLGLQKFIAETQVNTLQKNALTCCPDKYSCKPWMIWSKSNFLYFSLLFVVIITAVTNPEIAIFISLCIVFTSLIILMWFRLFCLYTFYNHKKDIPIKTSGRMKRPKVSILVPLYKEGRIINRLINRLSVIEYPNELLEIHLIYEQSDSDTKTAIMNLRLPDHIKSLQVPDGQLKTKPRAMNYALDFCTGSIIGIYDAEE